MYALIHDTQLILGPIKYNYRLINAELEELEIEERVSPRDGENVPLRINENTYLLPAVEIVPFCDSRFQSIGNFKWEIIREDEIPVKVEMTYSVNNKSLEEIKNEYKAQATSIRREKENTIIDIDINGTTVSVSTSREKRLVFVSKLMSLMSPLETYIFKFKDDLWMEVTKQELEYIISQIDLKIQAAFDWEYLKFKEIDACSTGEEVYNIILREPQEQETPDALRTNN